MTPLNVGQEFTFELEEGKTLIVKLVAIGPLHEESGARDVYFSLNGEARVVSIIDTTKPDSVGKSGTSSTRPKADPSKKGEVGAPMVNSAAFIYSLYIERSCCRSKSICRKYCQDWRPYCCDVCHENGDSNYCNHAW